MWIYTPEGFISIVRDREEPDMLHVRARRIEHLERFRGGHPERDLHPVRIDDGADYRYRIIAHENWVAGMIELMLKQMEYDNVKQATHDPDMIDVMNRVYSETLALDDRRPFHANVRDWDEIS